MPVGGEPIGIAAGFDSVWVVNSEFDSGDEPSVSRIDPAEGAVTATILVGTVPLEVAVAFDSVWVSNSEDDTVSRIDPATDEVSATIDVCEAPRGWPPTTSVSGSCARRAGPSCGSTRAPIEPGRRSRSGWNRGSSRSPSTRSGSRTTWIPRSRGSIPRPARRSQIDTEFGPQVMTEAGGGLWVSAVDSDSVQRIDPSTNEAGDPIDTEALPDGLLAHGDALWVATDLGPILQRVDPAAGEITGTWVVSNQGAINANQLLVDADGAFWFPLLDSGEVLKVAIPSG